MQKPSRGGRHHSKATIGIIHHTLQNHPDNIQDVVKLEGREAPILVNEEPELEGEGERVEDAADEWGSAYKQWPNGEKSLRRKILRENKNKGDLNSSS